MPRESPPLDLLIRNVRVVGGGDGTTDVGVAAGRIASIGPDATQASSELDMGGRWILPGLWDHHVHFAQWALVRRRVNLSHASSAEGVAQIIAARLRAEADSDAPLVGFGYRDARWPDVDAATLDAVAPLRPVVLVSGDMHGVWVNTAASQLLGCPPGLLREDPAFAVQRQLELLVPRYDETALSNAAAEAAARGVVGIVDLDMAPNIDLWQRRVADGMRALRVRAGFYPELLDDVIGRGFRTGDAVEGTDGLVSVGPLKLITDGSLNSRTAYCHDPYPGSAGRGVLTIPHAQVTAYLERAAGFGLHAAVHAIGDAANTHALDSFAATGARGSIEHAQLVAEADLARFARLGVVASVQPEHLWDDRDVADELWRGRTDRAFPFASLVAAGAKVALGSDAPVSPLDPWRAIAAAATRSGDDRDPWHQEQALTAAQALHAASGGAQVSAGEPADLVVVERDPLAASRDELLTMPVAATLLAGEFTHLSL